MPQLLRDCYNVNTQRNAIRCHCMTECVRVKTGYVVPFTEVSYITSYRVRVHDLALILSETIAVCRFALTEIQKSLLSFPLLEDL